MCSDGDLKPRDEVLLTTPIIQEILSGHIFNANRSPYLKVDEGFLVICWSSFPESSNPRLPKPQAALQEPQNNCLSLLFRWNFNSVII